MLEAVHGVTPNAKPKACIYSIGIDRAHSSLSGAGGAEDCSVDTNREALALLAEVAGLRSRSGRL